jgi:hypothetical protein
MDTVTSCITGEVHNVQTGTGGRRRRRSCSSRRSSCSSNNRNRREQGQGPTKRQEPLGSSCTAISSCVSHQTSSAVVQLRLYAAQP